MKELTLYSTKVGELPKMVRDETGMTFIPYSEVLEFKNSIIEILTDKKHTQYQNECYLSFKLSKIGIPKPWNQD